MPEPLTSYINDLSFACFVHEQYIFDVADEMRTLGTQLGWEGNPNSGIQAKKVADALEVEADHFAGGVATVAAKLILCLSWINSNWSVGGLTMDDILTEMLSATPTQLTKWVGITDAYKVAVWDAPFNAEYYAALARGFKTW